jgi:hypothetical protein
MEDQPVEMSEELYVSYLREKLELAEEDMREGLLVSHEDVMAETSRWFTE